MMEWSYLYLAIPPVVAVVGAIVGARLTKRSAARIDRMQTQFDREAAVRPQIKAQTIRTQGPTEASTEGRS